MSDRATKRIANYIISDRKIGGGNFGQVYLGTDALDDSSQVAIKVISRAKLTDKDTELLNGEVRALKACQNENIVKLYEVKKTVHNFYLILQYCDGGDLESYLTKKGCLSQRQALHILYQILNAFKTIVKMKFIHRDLKPENIFFKNGKIKVGDFGLCKLLSDRNSTRSCAGSLLNMAPEILRHESYDNKVDIYSIGTVLYQMLFGRPPFLAATHQGILQSILKGVKIDSLKISHQTQKLLKGMLCSDPRKRISWQELFRLEHKGNETQKIWENYNGLLMKMGIQKIGEKHIKLGTVCSEDQNETANDNCRSLDAWLSAGILKSLLEKTMYL